MKQSRIISASSIEDMNTKISEAESQGWTKFGEVSSDKMYDGVDEETNEVKTIDRFSCFVQKDVDVNELSLFKAQDILDAIEHGKKLGVESINTPETPSSTEQQYLTTILNSKVQTVEESNQS